MNLFSRFVLIVCAVAALCGCRTNALRVERAVEKIYSGRLGVVDSGMHSYRVEFVRIYDPHLGVVVREEGVQEGVIERVYVEVRDTIMVERVDTLLVAEGKTAPEAPQPIGNSLNLTWVIIGVVGVLVLGFLLFRLFRFLRL